MAAGTVSAAVVDVSEIANTKSFQQMMNTMMNVVTIPGIASGAITLTNAWNGVAPSTWAACSSSHGISLKNDERTKIDSGSANVMYGMISPGHVSYRPIWRHRLYSGPTSEICGKSATPSVTARMICLPGKSRRAIAYAAADAISTARHVAMSP